MERANIKVTLSVQYNADDHEWSIVGVMQRADGSESFMTSSRFLRSVLKRIVVDKIVSFATRKPGLPDSPVSEYDESTPL